MHTGGFFASQEAVHLYTNKTVFNDCVLFGLFNKLWEVLIPTTYYIVSHYLQKLINSL